jgi:uncharacterized OB-fold protein
MADDLDPELTPREPVAAGATRLSRARWLADRCGRVLIPAERGCVYCGGETLASQVRQLRYAVIGVGLVSVATTALLIYGLLR